MSPSFVHGLDSARLRFETIGQALDASVVKWGSNEALVVRHQGIRWTYTEFKQRVDALAAGLLALGLEPGDRVGIWSPNNAEWVLLQFATARAGLILVTLNPAYRVMELEQALLKSGCKAIVTAQRFKSSDYLEMLRSVAPRLPALRFMIHLGEESQPGMIAFPEVSLRGGSAERKRIGELAETLQFDDPINIQFTSGTTGTPKGAVLTHHNILNNGFFSGECLRLSEVDRLCIPVPLYHCFGMVLSNL